MLIYGVDWVLHFFQLISLPFFKSCIFNARTLITLKLMSLIKKTAGAIGIKTIYRSVRYLVLKLRGFRLLNPEQTNAFMAPYQVKAIDGNKTSLPRIINSADNQSTAFPQKDVVADRVFVWYYEDDRKTGRLSKYGSVIIKKHVLTTDYNYNSFYIGFKEGDKRPEKTAPAVMALFSQFQDGVMYGGYYDYVFLVAAKLSRIKDALPAHEFNKMAISYPLFNAPYEREYANLLGFDTVNLIDSTQTKLVSPRIVTANSAHWYPNLNDIQSLKENIQKRFQPVKTESNRIYISRKGRRCVTNEAELIELLKKFDFIIIEDKPRAVTEQISIYYNTSFILGPHGASFSNIIWCQPGAHLMELFSSNYVPDFFLYLAELSGMKYSAYYEEAAQKTGYLNALSEDIHVSIPKMQQCLERIFKQ